MIAFIDPETRELKAYYTHDTASKVWEEQGLQRVQVAEFAAWAVRKYGPGCVVKLDTIGDTVVAVERPPEPPAPPARPGLFSRVFRRGQER